MGEGGVCFDRAAGDVAGCRVPVGWGSGQRYVCQCAVREPGLHCPPVALLLKSRISPGFVRARRRRTSSGLFA